MNAPDRFQMMTAADIEALPYPEWLVKGILPRQGVALMSGPSACGKSFLILHLAAAINHGLRFFGHRTKRANVVYLALEDKGGFSVRAKAMRKACEGSNRLLVGDGWEDVTAPLDGVRFTTGDLSLDNPDDREALLASVLAAGADGGLLVIDTLACAMVGLDENSSGDMGAAIAGAKYLQECIGGLVLLVHHVGKNAAAGERGHSSLRAAADASILLERSGDVRTWTATKVKNAVDGVGGAFKLESVFLAHDEDGDDIVSAVAVPMTAPVEPIHKGAEASGKQQKRVLEIALATLTGKPPMPLAELKRIVAAGLDVDPKRRPETARRVLSKLFGAGLLACDAQELVSLPSDTRPPPAPTAEAEPSAPPLDPKAEALRLASLNPIDLALELPKVAKALMMSQADLKAVVRAARDELAKAASLTSPPKEDVAFA